MSKQLVFKLFMFMWIVPVLIYQHSHAPTQADGRIGRWAVPKGNSDFIPYSKGKSLIPFLIPKEERVRGPAGWGDWRQAQTGIADDGLSTGLCF